jgi:hypothetical protein
MAVFVFTDGRVEINSVNLSDHVRKVTLTPSADAQESTAMGATYRARLGGLKDWKVEVEFNQDYAASNVDVTLFALLGTTTTIKVRPTTSAIGATNPEYNGTVLLSEYVPIDGSVGDLAMAKASFDGAGVLTRSVA